MKILLITIRNIYEQTGEYKLIKRRAEELYNNFGIVTETISLQKYDRINKSKFVDDDSFKYKEKIRYNKRNFIISILKFRRQIKRYLENNKPKIIICSRGEIIYYDIIKKYCLRSACKIYIDVHGCHEELIEYNSGLKSKIGKVLTGALNYGWNKLFEINSNILVVSEYMKQYLEENFRINNNKFIVIPCGTDNKLNSVNNMLDTRKKWREKLGFAESDIVLVYSGGISKWQMIDTTLEVFNSLLCTNPNIKVCIFSSQKEPFSMFLEENCQKSNFRSLKNYEVTEALTCCDIGFILREDTLTNKVAFPTKFAEYLEGGLGIILSGVYSQEKIVEENKLGIIIDDINTINIDILSTKINQLIQIREANLGEYYKRCREVTEKQLNYKINVNKLGKHILS